MKNTQLAHIQISNEKDSTIYVIPMENTIEFLDELIAKGIDVSKAFLVKITQGA